MQIFSIIRKKVYKGHILSKSYMAQQSSNMPQSGAGLQRFTSEDPGKIKIKPAVVLVMLVVTVLIVLFLHMQGNSIFGLSGLTSALSAAAI